MAHYYEENPQGESDRRVIQARMHGMDFFFTTDAEVFSKKFLDFGSRTLLETAIEDLSANNRKKGKLLDLGCGYGPIGIIMMYPDNVQQIQSSRGRHAVDQLLWELGQRLPSFIRNEDIPCRYDGDVLCVIMPGAELKITRDRAEKIRNEISQLQISYGDAVLSTTLSLGVSVLPVHATDIETLIYAAEASMQMASNRGGNRGILADALQQR